VVPLIRGKRLNNGLKTKIQVGKEWTGIMMGLLVSPYVKNSKEFRDLK